MNTDGPRQNVHLHIDDISDRLVANIPDALLDLLEIAVYVFCADQAVRRGGRAAVDDGRRFRRAFELTVAVRQPQLWSSHAVRTSLQEALNLLSEDDFTFRFRPRATLPPAKQYFHFERGPGTSFAVDEVALFSGGLDSLAGAIEAACRRQRRVALVSHRSALKLAPPQEKLVENLKWMAADRIVHVPVVAFKEKGLAREHSQRVRTFLFVAIGAVVARLFGLNRLRIYENGVVSINLPISAQLVGARASRSTHPKAIQLLARFLSNVFGSEFALENPFLSYTKTEVVRLICDSGYRPLIRHTVSCAHPREMSRMHPHCGRCSQCIDRRFATVAAGCEADDPGESYALDVLRDAREAGPDRTVLESYVRSAKEMRALEPQEFLSRYPEVYRAVDGIPGMSPTAAAAMVEDLYRRHAADVTRVLGLAIAANATGIEQGTLPDTCAVVMGLDPKYRGRAPHVVGATPCLILERIGPSSEQRAGFLARLRGSGRFADVSKPLGSRQLFFIGAFFEASGAGCSDGSDVLEVTEADLMTRLERWASSGILKFSGRDRDRAEYRVRKMWDQFLRTLRHTAKLHGAFEVRIDPGDARSRIYRLKARPAELASRMGGIELAITAERQEVQPAT